MLGDYRIEKPLKKIKWCPPEKTTVKMNTDTALDLTNNAIGLGAIYRDDEGRVLGAAHEWWNLPILVNDVEFKAFLLGAKLAKELQVDSFLSESDCLQVISVTKSDDNPLCDFGNILKGVVREANSLNLWGFSHVARGGGGGGGGGGVGGAGGANVPAHVLAKTIS